MTNAPQIIACTTNVLDSLNPFPRNASCWLHLSSASDAGVQAIALALLRLRCCHIAVSGIGAERIHDGIDDIIIANEKSLVLTTWHIGEIVDVAQEVLVIGCPQTSDPVRVVISIADTLEQELATLSVMIAALGSAL